MRGISLKRRLMSFAFEMIPRINLSCKLVPVQYREYEYGLFQQGEKNTVSPCTTVS